MVTKHINIDASKSFQEKTLSSDFHSKRKERLHIYVSKTSLTVSPSETGQRAKQNEENCHRLEWCRCGKACQNNRMNL